MRIYLTLDQFKKLYTEGFLDGYDVEIIPDKNDGIKEISQKIDEIRDYVSGVEKTPLDGEKKESVDSLRAIIKDMSGTISTLREDIYSIKTEIAINFRDRNWNAMEKSETVAQETKKRRRKTGE